jgi:hypothetical protein
MKSNSLALLVGLLLLPALVTAQEDTLGRLVVPLVEGGFVAFKNETSSTGTTNTSAAGQQLLGEFRSKAFIDEDGVIHRVLIDSAGKYIFGYDLLIQAVAPSKTFNIAVKPLDLKIENNLLASDAEREPARIATLLQSSEPQILDDGDSFALDLLVNKESGVKIVDYVKVSFERSNLGDDNPTTLPRDFTLDAVALTIRDYRLFVDGNLVAAGKPGTIFSGALVWCYVEGQGRFIFSLVPRDGYEFQKVGIVKNNSIEFTVKGKRYEWFSDSAILPSGGTWNIWVLHDPKYLPFGSQEVVKKEKNKLEKLDDSIKAAQNKAARIGDPTPATFHKKTEEVQPVQTTKRFKVMVGAADRIENLWPRNR